MWIESSGEKETRLPFPHGIEVELQVIRKDGTWMRGDEILQVFDKLVSNAKNLLDKRIRVAQLVSVKRKYKGSSQTEEGERGSRIIASYEDPQGEIRDYTLVGHDPNVTSLTWILEVATPPCTTLEELAWWIQTLVAVTHESLPRDSRAIMVSTGLNPTQEYLRNLSFGEHHHILSRNVDDRVRIAVYNMIRNFMPHLIALSVNSPFENKRPTDIVTVDDQGRTRAPRCKRSIRLLKNTTQMGPTSEFELIPYLTGLDKEDFARRVNRSYARMVDVYPFTEYETIEVRVFDTQLSVPRRIGIALILQALGLKAKRIVENGEVVPDVGAKCLAANRESAVAAGLWGPFRMAAINQHEPYVAIYNSMVDDEGSIDGSRHNRFMADAVSSMFYLVKNELEELGLVDNPFMQPLLVSLFGSDSTEPRTTAADFQLDVYAKSDMNMVVLLKRLADITRECCINWLYDPLEGPPHLPSWLCWWKGLEPEIVPDSDRTLGGQEAGFSISFRNTTKHDFSDLTVTYTVEDSERNTVENKVFSIPRIGAGEINVTKVSFKTSIAASGYNVIAALGFAGKLINFSATISTYWMKAGIRPSATTQFADGHSRVSFSGEIETNYPSSMRLSVAATVLSLNKEMELAQTSRGLVVEKGDTLLLDDSMFPSLIIPADASQGVERCVLRIELVDEKGVRITTSASRPFYVGFMQRGPRILLRTDARTIHASGDLVHGEAELKGRGGTPTGDARLSIAFVSDSESTYGIAELGASQLLHDTYRFEWRIPHIESEQPPDRSGIIVASLTDRGEEISRAESARLKISPLSIRMSIDSLRTSERSAVGNTIAGWLRIRRNTDLGDPATLTMRLVFADGEEHTVLSQSVKPSRNLSVAYGPLTIPRPAGIRGSKSVTLVAELHYGGALLDRKSAEIDLTETAKDERLTLSLAGVPRFAAPDELVNLAVSVNNNSNEDARCRLSLYLDSAAGTRQLLKQDLELGPEQERTLGVSLRVPLAAEMSTAELRAIAERGRQTYETRQVFKVKAIEQALFHMDFSVKNERGEEIRGLIPRHSPVDITVKLRCPRSGIEGLEVVLRIMSRREVVKEFKIPVITSSGVGFEYAVKWITPVVDLVTGYYTDASILADGKALPNRAVETAQRQFTVY